MEIPPVRDMISISRGDNVMPMEIFVSCLDDLATLGRVRVGLDLSLFSPLVLFSFVLLSARRGMESFTSAVPLRSGRM